MDREVLRLKAHIDQTRSEMRGIVTKYESENLTRLVKACAEARFCDLDEREQLLVGMLAVVSIFDLIEEAT